MSFYYTWAESSSELSDHLLFVIHLSVNFSYFHFTLQNHLAKFNRTWHKASLGEGNSSLFNWRCNYPFQEKIIAKLQKYKEVKNFSLQYLPNLAQSIN